MFNRSIEEKAMRDPQNDELLSRLQSGDERALSDLADAYGTKIYQLAYRHLGNNEDAEEVAQDVLYKVYQSIGSFRGDAALSSWIYRITFNAAMSRLRTARYQRSQEEDRQAIACFHSEREKRKKEFFDTKQELVRRNTDPFAVSFEFERVRFSILVCRMQEHAGKGREARRRSYFSISYQNAAVFI